MMTQQINNIVFNQSSSSRIVVSSTSVYSQSEVNIYNENGNHSHFVKQNFRKWLRNVSNMHFIEFYCKLITRIDKYIPVGIIADFIFLQISFINLIRTWNIGAEKAQKSRYKLTLPLSSALRHFHVYRMYNNTHCTHLVWIRKKMLIFLCSPLRLTLCHRCSVSYVSIRSKHCSSNNNTLQRYCPFFLCFTYVRSSKY